MGSTASAPTKESTTKQRRIVGRSSYGSKVLSDAETLRFEIYHFEDIEKKRGEDVKTWGTPLKGHDRMWYISMYPRGAMKSKQYPEYVSIYLHCLDIKVAPSKKVKTKFTIELAPSSKKSISKTMEERTFSCEKDSMGCHMAKRADVLKCLDDYGTLVIDVHLQVYVEKKSVWYPKSVNDKNYTFNAMQLLESPLHSDVSFIVGEEQERIHGHKCVLVHRASVLYELVEGSRAEEMEISNITSSTFKTLLNYVYTGSLPDFGKKEAEVAKELMLASDRFGCTGLKLYIESEVTAKFVYEDNVSEWLCLADGHTCPLLKEFCMNSCRDNIAKVTTSPAWTQVKESSDLLEELIKYCGTEIRAPASNQDFEDMYVRMLREKLEASNLELDGTRRMLIERLKDHAASVASASGKRKRRRLRR